MPNDVKFENLLAKLKELHIIQKERPGEFVKELTGELKEEFALAHYLTTDGAASIGKGELGHSIYSIYGRCLGVECIAVIYKDYSIDSFKHEYKFFEMFPYQITYYSAVKKAKDVYSTAVEYWNEFYELNNIDIGKQRKLLFGDEADADDTKKWEKV